LNSLDIAIYLWYNYFMVDKYCKRCRTTKPLSEFIGYREVGRGILVTEETATNWCGQCNKEHADYQRALREANRPAKKAKRAIERQISGVDNREQLLEKARARVKRYIAKNPNYYKDVYTRNKEAHKAAVHNNQAMRKNAPGWHSADDIRSLLKTQKGLCWWCGKEWGEKYHVDHRIPLSRGGTNYVNNLVIACEGCNLSKNNKMPWEWIGRLL
jgi:5-methylcytosine-specific restriction endonuclease McrA